MKIELKAPVGAQTRAQCDKDTQGRDRSDC